MPGSSLLALIDDIATLLDDVAVLTKVATKKTAGVLGDDLALNAQQVTGVRAERELPVVWAVAKGSMVNKAILVPAALGISAVAPWAIVPLLMFGGAFLCFEGFEKIAHKLFHRREDEEQEAARHREQLQALADPSVDLVALESAKIKGAVRTDFILSAEIVTIALGTVATKPFGTRLAVLLSIAAVMTVGVYGLVAAIVKLDDLGLHLRERGQRAGGAQLEVRIGSAILLAAPWLMKGLSVAGTAAMFLVGGGILTHAIGPLHSWIEALVKSSGPLVAAILPTLLDALVGIAVGALALGLVTIVKRLRKTQQEAPAAK